jgi:hypothetical protein
MNNERKTFHESNLYQGNKDDYLTNLTSSNTNFHQYTQSMMDFRGNQVYSSYDQESDIQNTNTRTYDEGQVSSTVKIFTTIVSTPTILPPPKVVGPQTKTFKMKQEISNNHLTKEEQDSTNLKEHLNYEYPNEPFSLHEETTFIQEESSSLQEDSSSFQDDSSSIQEESSSSSQEEHPSMQEENSSFQDESSSMQEENSSYQEESSILEEQEVVTSFQEESSFLPEQEKVSSFQEESSAFKEDRFSSREESPVTQEEVPSFQDESSTFQDEVTSSEEETPPLKEDHSSSQEESSFLQEKVTSSQEETTALHEDRVSSIEEPPILQEENPSSLEESSALQDDVILSQEEPPPLNEEDSSSHEESSSIQDESFSVQEESLSILKKIQSMLEESSSEEKLDNNSHKLQIPNMMAALPKKKPLPIVKLPVLLANMEIDIDIFDSYDLFLPLSRITKLDWSVHSLESRVVLPSNTVFLKGVFIADIEYVKEKSTHSSKIQVPWQKTINVDWVYPPLMGSSSQEEFMFDDGNENSIHHQFHEQYADQIQHHLQSMNFIWHEELHLQADTPKLFIQGRAILSIDLLQPQYIDLNLM